MPGRFPLNSAPSTTDPFCDDDFCGGPGCSQLIVPENGLDWGRTIAVQVVCSGQTVQWIRNETAIPGAVGNSYTIGIDDMDQFISAVITCPSGETILSCIAQVTIESFEPKNYDYWRIRRYNGTVTDWYLTAVWAAGFYVFDIAGLNYTNQRHKWSAGAQICYTGKWIQGGVGAVNRIPADGDFVPNVNQIQLQYYDITGGDPSLGNNQPTATYCSVQGPGIFEFANSENPTLVVYQWKGTFNGLPAPSYPTLVGPAPAPSPILSISAAPEPIGFGAPSGNTRSWSESAGRFSLISTPLIGDPFCDDDFCGGPGCSQLIVPSSGLDWGSTVAVQVICSGQTVQWLRNEIIISGATGNSYTIGNDDMGQSISAIITCPSGEITQSCAASVIPGAFDTSQYNYARFIGTKIGRYYVGGPLTQTGGGFRIQQEATTSWLRISDLPAGQSDPALCFLTVRYEGVGTAPKNPPGSIFLPEGSYPWVCNFDSYVVEENSNFIASNVCRTWIFRDGILINEIDGVSASNSNKQIGEIYATCRGRWQFKKSATQPLPSAPADAQWGGSMGGFNLAAAWLVQPTVPPYTLIIS